MRAYHFVYPVGVFTVYIIFTIIYYALGGVNEVGFHGVYEILDWSKPEQAAVITLSCIVALIVLHLLCWIIQKLRYCVFLIVKRLFY